MRHLLRSLILFLALGAFFYGSSFARAPIGFFSELTSAFAAPFLLAKNISLYGSLSNNLIKLELENQNLNAKLLALSIKSPRDEGHLMRAKIFAAYPFNDKRNITLAAGADDGIEIGDAVLAASRIFFGQITAVGKNWSEARTVFDGTREIAVRIGARGVPALLKGGAAVSVQMIDRSKGVAAGDAVYTASRDLPYGLKIGEVSDVRGGSGGAFGEADVRLPYSFVDLDEVLVMIGK